MLRVGLDIFIHAVQRRGEELLAELEQIGPDLAAGNCQCVEGIEIDVRGNRRDDPRKSQSQPSAPGRHAASRGVGEERTVVR
jgi:hypothetical protein